MLKGTASVFLLGPSINGAKRLVLFDATSQFVAAGGLAPYVFTLTIGSKGSIDAAGLYTAPLSAAPDEGSFTVVVTDANLKTGQLVGNYTALTSTITIAVPAEQEATPTGSVLMTATGGASAHYAWLLSPGSQGDSVNPTTGLYSWTNPPFQGSFSDTVLVDDTFGNSDNQGVTVWKFIETINSTPVSKVYGQTLQFDVIYGKAPRATSVFSGPGSIDGAGLFTCPTSGAAGPAGSVASVLRWTDALGKVATITVNTTSNLALSPNTSQNMATAGTLQFSTTGGVGPMVYTVALTGGGACVATISSPGGLLTGGGVTENVTVTVTDSEAFVRTCPVIISDALAIAPTTATVYLNHTQTFTPSGGTAPYAFSKVSGEGSITTPGGIYSAPVSAYGTGTATVRVTDNVAATADAVVTLGAVAGSVLFDGIDGFVNFGDILDMERTDSRSWSCWVNFSSNSNGTIGKLDSSGNFQGWAIIGDTNGAGALDYGMQLYLVNDFGTSNVRAFESAKVMSYNTWYHFCITYPGDSTTAILYINGAVEASFAGSGTLSGSISNTRDLCIGGLDGTFNWSTGNITNVSVHNVALTAGQVLTLYNGGLIPQVITLGGTVETSCIFYAPMWAADVYPTIEELISGNDGTMTGMIAGDLTSTTP